MASPPRSRNGLLPAAAHKDYHPFTDWDFLNALEISRSVGEGTGWTPCHIMLEDEHKNPQAFAPLYLKSHSMGEYVFDHAWADASQRAGIAYYPKLQCAVPFTPARGPRLITNSPEAETALIKATQQFCDQNNLSGVHVTFIGERLQSRLAAQGFLARTDRQFHFINRRYENFDQFLAALTSRKRKKIKTERRRACEHVTIKRLRGDQISFEDWDAFYSFYLDTSERKWGQAYLTRDFFQAIHETMRDQVLLIMAYQDDTPIAGALNFIGGDALYGRHWGACKHIQFLHFELCYYQAIEAAIEMGLSRVEAGAQGEHKLARGYEPVTTYSAHYLAHAGLRDAVDNFLS
ncbi:MAG: N-acetyltransferase, partial [Robiginitomaculum sp.]|nr:N-acetyltransferase [Robiginitomaculum sp.]